MSDLTLTVGGRSISGWSKVRVTRGVERCPTDFAISATSDSPIYQDAVGIVEGQTCTVSLGGDRVVTGYVDAVQPWYDAHAHEVRVVGRGKCADLVDCSAEWATGQIGNTNLVDIATKLAGPYGIGVTDLAGVGDTIPQFNINIGETPWSILERVARQNAMLVYEDEFGDLVFAQAGSDVAASGFQEGVNVQAAAVTRSVAERFQTYLCSLTSVMQLSDLGPQDPFFGRQSDPNVRRNRKLYLVAEQVEGAQQLVQRRAAWEMNRRYGRGNMVTVTADSWRDAAGQLWTPNTLATVSLPRLGLHQAQLCIGEVAYVLDERGISVEVTLAPRQAYLPEPIQLQPILQGLTS